MRTVGTGSSFYVFQVGLAFGKRATNTYDNKMPRRQSYHNIVYQDSAQSSCWALT